MTCADVKDHLVEVYLNFSENFYEFLSKASIGISRNRHEDDASVIKKSLCVAETFRAITRYE